MLGALTDGGLVVPPAARKRPPPRFRVTSIARSMGLENERYRYFKELSAGLRSLEGKHLDLHATLADQDPENWKKVKQLALEQFPWLNQYEEAWPLDLIMQRQLERTEYEYRKSQKRGERSRSNSRYDDDDDVQRPRKGPCTRSLTRRAERDAFQTRKTSLEQAAQQASQEHSTQSDARCSATHRGSGIQQSASIVVSGSTDSDLIQSNSQTLCSGHSSDSAQSLIYKKTPQLSGAQQVKDFLKSLTPNMEELADKFIEAGIVNEECIQNLALMHDAEKIGFLRDDLRLLPFYSRGVRVGLARKVAVEGTMDFVA